MTSSGDKLYAWQVQEPNGCWSMVGAMMAGSHVPLINRDLELMKKVRPLAENHARASGQPLRLVCFELSWVVDEPNI